ncbi:MAG: DsbC family protein [Pseudomonadota bacterium]
MKHLSTLCLLLISALATHAAQADAAADQQALEAALAELFPNQSAPVITPSPVEGMSEVAFGTQLFYVSNDGQFLLGGPLISVAERENLTEARMAVARQDILVEAADASLYRYAASPAKHRVTVVTDIDCPYCRRLHQDLASYQDAGIDVRYVMLPRSGVGSGSYRKAVAAACSEDPEAAITAAMNGENFTDADTSCEHPIDDHMALARRLGASSTPTLYLEDGRMLLGAKPVDEVLAAIAEP